jgi:hemimethylated DNA binding protein
MHSYHILRSASTLRLCSGCEGVVYGWDKQCERDPEWAAAVQADPDQPFYHVLPDEGEGLT